MHSQLWAIARYTLLEHLRGRMAASALFVLTAALILSRLLDGVAVTEAAALQATLTGAWLRLAMVILLSSAIIVSQVREAGDRTRDWLLAFPMPRSVWLGGRLLGHAAAAGLLALCAMLPLLGTAGVAGTLLWGAGLCLELLVCTCMAVFLSISLTQAPAALLGLAGWYLLSRSMAALQLVAAAPLLDDGTAFMHLSPWVLKGIAFLLPRFDLLSQGTDLSRGALGLATVTAWAALPALALQMLVYAGLLVCASQVDLARREW